MSLRVISPTPYLRMGMSCSLASYARASRDPMASALMVMPFSWVSILMLVSSARALMAGSLGPFTTMIGAPAMTPSQFWHDIFTPAAAWSSFTESNLSLGSRISSRGLGLRMAFIFVTTGAPRVPMATVSPFFRVPE